MSRLDEVKYGEGALAHSDCRRTIYDPLQKVEGTWYVHNVIKLNQKGLELGKHYHDFEELFFTPTGGFRFALADIDEGKPKVYELEEGSRIVIPKNVAHIIVGESGAILNGFGNIPFDPKRMFQCEEGLIKILQEALH